MQSIILLFCSIFLCLIFSGNAHEYSNRWTVQIDGDQHEADRLARKHGFVSLGEIIDNYYSFQHHKVEGISSAPSTHVHKGLMSEPNVKRVEQQKLKSYNLLSSQSSDMYMTDPRWGNMWYINRKNGQPTYNVIDVWKRNVTGEGVVVAVVDDGFDPEHPDLRDNFDIKASYDFIDLDDIPLSNNKSYPQDGHGDKSAGIIAAAHNNSKCGVGLAFNARLGGIRLFFRTKASDADEARALSYAKKYIDIYSNSWGPTDRGFEVAGPGHLTQRALQNGAEKGRRGLGSIYVFAAGNGGPMVKDSCAFNGYVNSIYTIAISGLNSDGAIPGYGERCAGIMAVTYSNDFFGSSPVITTDAKKSCTDDFGGSSAATAMASGLIALMLSANRDLSWRDVQHIIVRSARPDPAQITGSSWIRNKAGLRVNDYVGFGLMDARKMVDLAVNWKKVPSKVTCTIPGPRINSPIPSQGKLEERIDLSNWSDFCGDAINFLEHVEVKVDLTYSLRGDLLIKLESPQGTVSNLTHYRFADSAYGFQDLDWVLMSLHYWGENATGQWRLTLENANLDNHNTGTLFNWKLILHGTTLNPLASNRHVPAPVSPQPTEKASTATIPTPESRQRSTTPPPDGCKDKRPDRCSLWARKGFCNRTYVSFMKENCMKTCNVCGGGGSRSSCEKGYERNEAGQCVDVNECDGRNGGCHDGFECVNTRGSYFCRKCPNGYGLVWYKGERRCSDINECDLNISGCGRGCVNTRGSYYCTCPKGYTLSNNRRTCRDVNECNRGTSRCSQRCVNTYGSYYCTCPKGYTLSNNRRTCRDVNECNRGTSRCSHGCVNTYGSYYCTCPKGYRLLDNRRTCRGTAGSRANADCHR